jgi:cation diffusion facilitator family transporter
MEPGRNREEKAIRVAIACSLFGSVTKIVAGAITGSMAMISSAIDSLGDLIVSGANLVAVRYGGQPPDAEHNYGHSKIEGLAAMFEGGFIFASGAFVIYEAIHKAILGEVTHNSVVGIAVMIPVLAATAGTVVYLRKVGRETGSLILKADSTHYLSDVWVNTGVLVALVLVKLTGQPLIDTGISIVIALLMLRSSVLVLRDGFDLVMDKSLEPAIVDRLRSELGACTKIESFHDFKTRRGKIPVVDFHVVVRPEMTAKELHHVFLELREGVRRIAGPSAKVLMHADPGEASFDGPTVMTVEAPSRSAVEAQRSVAHD